MKYFQRVKEDSGAANSVSFIIIIFVVMLIMVSFIDIGIYFNVKNEMQSAAENGARNVALYGGSQTTTLRRVKGTAYRDVKDAEEVVLESINYKFKEGGGSKTVEVKTVSCGPSGGAAAGDKVWCNVDYIYRGLIGNRGLFFQKDQVVTVQGSSVSEVFSQN